MFRKVKYFKITLDSKKQLNVTLRNLTQPYATLEKGFTLVEIMVAITVFALVTVAGGGVFISVQQAWQRQRNTIDLIQNARWAMERMGNEVRQAGRATVSVGSESWGAESVVRLQFELPPGGAPNGVRYFRGNNGAFGPSSALYRKSGAGLGPPADRQELANFIVDNPSGNPLFNWDAVAGVLTMELTVRPKPAEAEGPGNRNYTLRTQVRPRN